MATTEQSEWDMAGLNEDSPMLAKLIENIRSEFNLNGDVDTDSPHRVLTEFPDAVHSDFDMVLNAMANLIAENIYDRFLKKLEDNSDVWAGYDRGTVRYFLNEGYRIWVAVVLIPSDASKMQRLPYEMTIDLGSRGQFDGKTPAEIDDWFDDQADQIIQQLETEYR